MTLRVAPGMVLCKKPETISERGGLILPEEEINMVAEVIQIGPPLDRSLVDEWNNTDVNPECFLMIGDHVVLPTLNGQIHDGNIAVRYRDIHIYMRDDEVKKTSAEWAEYSDFFVINADGWDRENFEYSWGEELITRKEFDLRVMKSTLMSK